MRELLAAEASDRQAAEAIALYCYSARKALGGLVAALGALDTLVFTGGIGEHAAPIRERIVMDMTGFGIQIDPDRNRTHEPVISTDESSVTVRVIPTAEDRYWPATRSDCCRGPNDISIQSSALQCGRCG